MIETLDVWRAILALAMVFAAARLYFIHQGLKGRNQPFTEEMRVYSAVLALGGITLFAEVMARL